MIRTLSFVASAFLLVVLAAASAVASPPRHVRLSWAESDTARTMTVAWNTSVETVTQVRYGVDETYGLVAEGASALLPGPLGWVHEVTLTELEPDTVYHYRVGGPMGWSDDLTFRTAPLSDGCTPFSFIALGDNRSDDGRGSSPKWPGILGEAIADDPGFVVNTGDLVKDGGVIEQWEVFLEDTSPAAQYVPLMTTMGNHDDGPGQGDGAHYNQVFALPRNDVSGTEDYYWFTYGNAIIVSLSTVSFEGGDYAYQEQADWLDRVLTENPQPWKIVFFHHPPYTGYVDLFGLDVNHPPNEKGQNPALGPIFDKHHVDIVFNGHNHFYQRFQAMQYSSADPEEGIPVDDPGRGTIYAITGGAGALTYAIDLYMWGLCAFTTGAEVCDGKHHYVVVEIDGDTLRYTALTTAQQLLGSDPDNVEVIDSFELVKPEVTPNCVAPPVDEGTPQDAGSTDVVTTVDAGPTDIGVPDIGAPDVVTPVEVITTPDVPAPSEDVAVATPDEGTPSSEDVPTADQSSAEDDVSAVADSGPPTGDSAGAPDAAAPGGGTSVGGGGCAAAPATPTTPLALLLLLLALLALRAIPRRQ